MNSIATLAQLKEYVGATSDVSDLRLQSILDGAVGFIEKMSGRQFNMQPPPNEKGEDKEPPVQKIFDTRGKTTIKIPDVREVTELNINGFPLKPRSQSVLFGYVLEGTSGMPFTEIRIYQWSLALAGYWTDGMKDCYVTGRWGWNPVAPEIFEAVMSLAARRYKEKDANYADAIMTEGGMFSYFRTLPPFVQDVIRSYKEPRFALV